MPEFQAGLFVQVIDTLWFKASISNLPTSPRGELDRTRTNGSIYAELGTQTIAENV